MSKVPRRKQIFVGCEGQSERSYVAFLGMLAKDAGLHVHLETRILNGGDAKTCVTKAVSEAVKYRTGNSSKIPAFILVDTDRADGHKSNIVALAKAQQLTVIWQVPCHEALMLRHLAGHENDKPANCNLALASLSTLWKSYAKGLASRQIASVLDQKGVFRAASVTPELQQLLGEIGLK